MKELYYEDWETQKLESEEVEKLSFVTYVYDNGDVKMYKSPEGEKYVCAIYKCKLQDGSTEVLRFKEPYEPETIFAIERDIGWNFTKYEDTDFELDVIPDSINSTREEIELYENKGVKLSRPGRVSKDLQRYINADKQKRFILEKILKEPTLSMYHDVARVKLIYLETPVSETSENFKESKKNYAILHRQLNELVETFRLDE